MERYFGQFWRRPWTDYRALAQSLDWENGPEIRLWDRYLLLSEAFVVPKEVLLLITAFHGSDRRVVSHKPTSGSLPPQDI